jgi:hypothetical protein
VKEVWVQIDRRGQVCHPYTPPPGSLAGDRACPVWRGKLGRHRLDGKVAWHLHVPKFRERYRPGRYVAHVYACDASRNCETKVRPSNRAYFRVR